MRIAVLGLGEAGSIYARGLAERGAEVVGVDPNVTDPPAGVVHLPSIAEAVTGADLVHHEIDPLAELVRVHLLCVARARLVGLDPDVPRNLTRSIILSPAAPPPA